MLKKTTGEHLRKRIDLFFKEFPTPEALFESDDKDLTAVVKPYGLWRKRRKELRELARSLVQQGSPRSRDEVLSLYGAGDYVADSYCIFVLRDFFVVPSDAELREFLEHGIERAPSNARRLRR